MAFLGYFPNVFLNQDDSIPKICTSVPNIASQAQENVDVFLSCKLLHNVGLLTSDLSLLTFDYKSARFLI